MKLISLATELINMDIENKLCSNIKGNRNWCIRTEHYITPNGQEIKKAYVGKFGAFKRRHMLSAFIVDIAKYHIRWYGYTYKRDFEHTMMILAENEYYIHWI